ncbi:hypothetical protein C8Q74DRAFT_1208306 [Fomes fomentarius]|nr:hypothetical protein C8Q74DRAFT_1208306 [Fomes fomentarius]
MLRRRRIRNTITLSRAESFPGRQFDFRVHKWTQRPDWTPRHLPKDGAHLTLELGRRIGGGRSAVVYAAKINADAASMLMPRIPDEEICVKIARPNRSRTLAREAWAYEVLVGQGCLGVMVPRCYGFFTVDLSRDQLSFPLWSSGDFYLEEASSGLPDDPMCDDPLTDDDPYELDDSLGPGTREISSWLDWKPDPAAPLLSVLVMARGGQSYHSVDSYDCDQESTVDIYQILNDLSHAFVLHNDFSTHNLVRAPKNTTVCSRHQRVHKWNLVDFPWVSVDDFGEGHDEKWRSLSKLQRDHFRFLRC